MSTKQIQPSEQLVQSLIALRDELYEKQNSNHVEVFWKINSCLYNTYPHAEHVHGESNG